MTHQSHGDEEGVFAADLIAEPAEDQRAERAHGETGGKGEQGEDEADIRRHVGEEIFRQEHAQRAVDVEVIPFENGAQRGSENDESLFARHPAVRVALIAIVVMGVPPSSLLGECGTSSSRRAALHRVRLVAGAPVCPPEVVSQKSWVLCALTAVAA